MNPYDEILSSIVELKVGDKFHAITPQSNPESRLIHIDHVIESKNGGILYVYSFYGKRKKMWFESMCSQFDMACYIRHFKNKK